MKNLTFAKFKACIVAVVSEDKDGDEHIGTGFHIGDGLIATARHVIENRNNLRIFNYFYLETHGEQYTAEEIYYPENPLADVAVLATNFVSKVRTGEEADHIPIGVEWDDFVKNDSLILYDVIVMGYPAIPTGFPTLVTIATQINGIVDQYYYQGQLPPPCYILSGIPRGGFSGAPMLVDFGEDSFVMGIVTSSLYKNDEPLETGFMAAVTIESLLDTLHFHKLYPASNGLMVKAFASELTPEEEKELMKGKDN